jgi:aspartate racemase
MACAGAQTAVLPAVTPHICIKELTPLLRIPLLNIVDVLTAELKRRKTKRIALMGSVFTVQGSLWGQLKGIEIVKPQPDEIAFIGQAYQRILDNRSAAADAGELRRIAVNLQRRDGVEIILLAGTDLTVMFDEASAGFPCLDVARLHIEAIVERLAC